MRYSIFLLFYSTLIITNLTFSQKVVINGTSGEIEDYPKNPYYSGDTVFFKIKNANLLKYSYEMKVDKEIFLVKDYNVIGLKNEAVVNAADVTQFTDLINEKNILSLDGSNNDTNKDKSYIDKLNQILDDVNIRMNLLNSNIINLIIRFNNRYDEKIIPAIKNDNINWNEEYFDSCEVLNDDYTRELNNIYSIRDKILEFNVEWNKAKLDGALKDKTPIGFEEIEKKLNLSSNYILRIKAILDRWSFIKKTTTPVITQVLRIGQSPKRYIVSISWKKINEPKISDPTRYLFPQTMTEQKPENEELVKKITFEIEGHTKSYFNFNLGLAQYFFDHDNSYFFQPYITPDDSLKYKISKNNLQSQTKFFMSLGIYFLSFSSDGIKLFSGVDELETNSNIWNLMLMIGANISAPPKNFMLGLGLDHKAGFNLNLGIATYTATVLNADWQEGQVITPEIKSVIVNPPTNTSTEIGWFVSIGFRPQIFNFFKSLFGMNL